MKLDGAMAIASGGLANISRQMALLSHNVANANTPDYALEVTTQSSLTAEGDGQGVRSGLARRQIDTALQAASFRQSSVVAGLQVKQDALQAIDSVQGTPGQNGDLPSLVGALGDTFTALLNSPANQAAQSAVVAAAGTLVRGINAMADAYATQRQKAQTDLESSLGTLNATLQQVGSLSDQIILQRVRGQGTADLENQRAAAVHGLSALLDVRTAEQANGDLLVITPSGLTLPTRGSGTSLATVGANLDPTTTYANGGIPPITLVRADVTGHLQGGRIGADLELRDLTLPTWQGELDEFAFSLTARFAAQGLTLFTSPDGTVPAGGGTPAQSGYVGFAGTIQVNSAVQAQPRLVRDGTDPVAGSPSGATAFTPNPPGGPAGFTALSARVATYALGDQVQAGVAQPPTNTTDLGPDGSLSAPYTSPASLGALAATLVAAQAQETATATNRLTTEQAVQTGLADRLATNSGVNMDTEMSLMISLQTAYGANARVIAAVQSLFTELLNAVHL
jgi:flagellar hook-associated protein 1 FlgK